MTEVDPQGRSWVAGYAGPSVLLEKRARRRDWTFGKTEGAQSSESHKWWRNDRHATASRAANSDVDQLWTEVHGGVPLQDFTGNKMNEFTKKDLRASHITMKAVADHEEVEPLKSSYCSDFCDNMGNTEAAQLREMTDHSKRIARENKQRALGASVQQALQDSDGL
ncbi:unnamed protein product [Pedinophyceae sp. YPF-701]|nr:unnamed protein product [Pedinophyceae sp. YPF-701]